MSILSEGVGEKKKTFDPTMDVSLGNDAMRGCWPEGADSHRVINIGG